MKRPLSAVCFPHVICRGFRGVRYPTVTDWCVCVCFMKKYADISNTKITCHPRFCHPVSSIFYTTHKHFLPSPTLTTCPLTAVLPQAVCIEEGKVDKAPGGRYLF